jgi:tetratricopeptide (TPR) repeat protein
MANERGEQLENAGNTTKALEKYRYAASLLEQISRDDPKWQPIVVDYRKKKISENIARLEQQAGSQPSSPGPEAASVPLEGELPQKENNSIPGLNTSPTESLPAAPSPAPAPAAAGSSQEVRDQIQELEDDLRDSRQKLKSVESEKESLAGRLDDALHELDQTKVTDAELKGQLKQAQDAYQNAIADHSQAPGNLKAYQTRISQLESALKDAEADRDAADEQNADYARRATRAHQAATALAQQRDAANAHAQDLESKYADASKLAAKLDAATRQIAALTKDRDDARQRADDLDTKLAATSKLAAKLDAAQKQIATLKAGATVAESKNSDLTGQLADARKQVDQITADRDAARQRITALNGKLADAQSQIVSVKAERDQIAAQRDQALAELGKAKQAEARVNQLLADNASLSQKLSDDEKIIKDFKSGSPEKDKEIAALRKQVSDTQALLATTQQQRDNMQSSLNDLQQQYDSTSAELTQLKAGGGVGDAEKKTLTDENGLLRGIVLRELKAQARRDQAKKLVMDQLSQLKVQSDTLLTEINYLGEPVVQLTDKEKALFKDASLDIPDADNSSMAISIAAPKQTADAADTSGSTTQLASFTSPGSTIPGKPQSSPAATSGASPEGESASSGDTSAGPMVPPDLMDDAKSAKEAFERQQYRDAERIYEKMLTKAPNNVYILSNLGVVYFRNEKWKLAEESLKKAIAVAPEDTFSHCTLGIVYYQEKRYDDAINSLTRALAINPKYAVAHNYLGITASQKGWQEAALKELETAIDLDPNYGDACFNLAVVYAMQQPPNKEMARKYYQRAIADGAEPDQGLEQLVK